MKEASCGMTGKNICASCGEGRGTAAAVLQHQGISADRTGDTRIHLSCGIWMRHSWGAAVHFRLCVVGERLPYMEENKSICPYSGPPTAPTVRAKCDRSPITWPH